MTPARKALESIEEARSQVGRLRRSVQQLQSKCTGGVSNYSGMPTGHRADHPALWDTLAERKTLLEEQEKQLRELEDKMEGLIDLLPHPRWRMVLRCHYMDSMELPDVAQELTKSTGREFTMNQIYRFHRKALDAADELWHLN